MGPWLPELTESLPVDRDLLDGPRLLLESGKAPSSRPTVPDPPEQPPAPNPRPELRESLPVGRDIPDGPHLLLEHRKALSSRPMVPNPPEQSSAPNPRGD